MRCEISTYTRIKDDLPFEPSLLHLFDSPSLALFAEPPMLCHLEDSHVVATGTPEIRERKGRRGIEGGGEGVGGSAGGGRGSGRKVRVEQRGERRLKGGERSVDCNSEEVRTEATRRFGAWWLTRLQENVEAAFDEPFLALVVDTGNLVTASGAPLHFRGQLPEAVSSPNGQNEVEQAPKRRKGEGGVAMSAWRDMRMSTRDEKSI